MKIDLKHAIFSIKDGSGTPKTLEIKIGEGTLTFSEKRTIEYVKNRGLLDTTREGDQDPVDIRFDFIWEHLKSATGDTVPTPYEALKKIGAASTWTSSDSDACQPYAVDIELVYTAPCGTDVETITFSDFRYESIDGDPKAGTVSVTGKANIVAPTITRV
jgi:hypothetical protein